MQEDEYEIDDFFQTNEPLILVGRRDNGSYTIKICSHMDMEQLTDSLCYIIKTAISSLENAAEINEIAELEILRLTEEKIINDENPYSEIDDE